MRRLKEIFGVYSESKLWHMAHDRLHPVPGNQKPATKKRIMRMALNYGSHFNRRRLLDGVGADKEASKRNCGE
jgi:hypothetical protein